MTTTRLETPVRGGPGYWWGSYLRMLRWVLTQQKVLFVGIVFSQLVLGIGAAVMYKFYLGDVDPVTALFLVSGIPALALIPVGFLLGGFAHSEGDPGLGILLVPVGALLVISVAARQAIRAWRG